MDTFTEDYLKMTNKQICKKYKIKSVRDLKALLKTKNIKPKILNFDKDQIITDYKNGLSLDEIAKNHFIDRDSVQRTKKRHSIENYSINRVNDPDTMKKYSAKDYKCYNHKNKDYRYLVECPSCHNDYWIQTFNHIKAVDNNKRRICRKCSKNSDYCSDTFSKMKIKQNNTSGFIGVGIQTDSKTKEPIGFYASISYKKSKILRNFYKDRDLLQKTKVQAAVDRDLFIIEKELPHTRNFTDIELIGNMEYLAHKQLENIKQRLSSGKHKV